MPELSNHDWFQQALVEITNDPEVREQLSREQTDPHYAARRARQRAARSAMTTGDVTLLKRLRATSSLAKKESQELNALKQARQNHAKRDAMVSEMLVLAAVDPASFRRYIMDHRTQSERRVLNTPPVRDLTRRALRNVIASISADRVRRISRGEASPDWLQRSEFAKEMARLRWRATFTGDRVPEKKSGKDA